MVIVFCYCFLSLLFAIGFLPLFFGNFFWQFFFYLYNFCCIVWIASEILWDYIVLIVSYKIVLYELYYEFLLCRFRLYYANLIIKLYYKIVLWGYGIVLYNLYYADFILYILSYFFSGFYSAIPVLRTLSCSIMLILCYIFYCSNFIIYIPSYTIV